MLESAAAGSGSQDGDGGEGSQDGNQAEHYLTFGGEDGIVGERPEWCPEQSWTDDKGLDVQKLAKSYHDLRNGLNTAVAEARSLDKAGAMKSPDVFLENFKAPESTEERDVSRWGDLGPDDPIVDAFAKASHLHGMSEKRAHAFMTDVMVFANEALPEPVNMGEEWGRLGGEERGKKLAGAVVADLKAMTGEGANALNEQELGAMLEFGNNANRISALSKIMAEARGPASPGIPRGGVALDGAPSLAEAHAAQGKTVESGPHKGQMLYEVDPVYRAKVDKMFEDAAGTDPGQTTSRLPVGVGNA